MVGVDVALAGNLFGFGLDGTVVVLGAEEVEFDLIVLSGKDSA
jgi:hypothetical protein